MYVCMYVCMYVFMYGCMYVVVKWGHRIEDSLIMLSGRLLFDAVYNVLYDGY